MFQMIFESLTKILVENKSKYLNIVNVVFYCPIAHVLIQHFHYCSVGAPVESSHEV